MNNLKKVIPTKQAKDLYDALRTRGVDAILEYPDGFKTVDIAILPAHIYIEVDGLHHFTDSGQIIRDFKRSHFSDGDDFNTFYVTNQLIDKCLNKIADALAEVVKIKTKKL